MYLEGLLVAAFVGAMSQPPKWVWPLLLLFWPLSLPLLAYKTYKKYEPIIRQVRENPLLGSLMGFSSPPANPFMSILDSTAEPLFPKSEGPNPFLGNLFTEAEPNGELAELMKLAEEASSNETTKSTDSEESDTKDGDQPQ